MGMTASTVLLRAGLLGAPNIENPSFEADTFIEGPGYASANGGVITGWSFQGMVGINPYYVGEEKQPMGPFTDNGVIPDGDQVAVCHQNARLSQRIAGFEAGKRYVVRYYENARHNNRPLQVPELEVRLGNEVIVSKHPVATVDDFRSHRLQYAEVISAPFTAPEDGAYTLEFITTGTQASAMIDHVRIEELDDESGSE